MRSSSTVLDAVRHDACQFGRRQTGVAQGGRQGAANGISPRPGSGLMTYLQTARLKRDGAAEHAGENRDAAGLGMRRVSNSNAPDPSPLTRPSRWASKGREAAAGLIAPPRQPNRMRCGPTTWDEAARRRRRRSLPQPDPARESAWPRPAPRGDTSPIVMVLFGPRASWPMPM